MIITTTSPSRDENKMLQGSTLRLYPHTREAITSHPTNATLTTKFRALFSHHATRVLCLTRRGWEGTQRIQPHPGQLTHTKYVCFSDKHQQGIAISFTNVLPNTAISTDATRNDYCGTNTPRPRTRTSYHITGRLAHASTTCLLHVLRLYQS